MQRRVLFYLISGALVFWCYYQSTALATNSADSAAINLRDPFSADQFSETAQILDNYPLDKFKMLGTVIQDNQIWGIVRAPNGKIYPVALGGILGQEHGHIVSITSQHIAVQETIVDNGATRQQLSSLMLAPLK